MLRLARLPRLYRLLRILRLIKLVKILRYNATFNKFTEKLKVNAGVTRMIVTLVVSMFCVHLISCFWFLASKMSDHNPKTWVANRGIQDMEPRNQYIECFYWSMQTLTTVGYGDFGAKTTSEILLSLFWMLFGVSFYSFRNW